MRCDAPRIGCSLLAIAVIVVSWCACRQPMAKDPIMTDCHDGTFCGPAFPFCTGRAEHPCEAAGPEGVATAWGALPRRDAGVIVLCVPYVDGGCDP